MAEPRTLAERAENFHADARTDRERFNGYGVMGLPFASGHILGLRRFPASSIGPGYTSIWHRNPAGEWTFYADSEPLQSCNRFFGRAITEFRQAVISIHWSGPRSLSVGVPGELGWELTAQATPVTRLMNSLGSLLPNSLWRNEHVLAAMGLIASSLLGAGKLRLYGTAPNGQHFVANPRLIWTIPRSTAIINGKDLGPLGPVTPQSWLGDFAIPNRGLLAFGGAAFDPFDASRHLSAVTSAE